ncbi:sporulation protein [Frankia sp. CNm7]|uniref:Sporulation protein n=1 Tax=Frankia nepalensis TaxID=1836974 RepID=A0A937R8K5_9ACTN|nr:sporulation protein [Frankia nepalensis]MBL7496474.1 sporulation protein [Frankia nepalensis]MBL7515294.1 sporulation protein [Frankia nepalensis]MBL7519654.1 sporulation protein [Frankia nepalensis]MBL7625880.1 sporulation protein [Frankia nepalensis]
MGMKRFMSRLGVGGAEVETVLDRDQTWPGAVVTGTTTVTGGKVEQQIEKILVALEATVEVEYDDSTYYEKVAFGTQEIGGNLLVHPGQQVSGRFELPVPWQTPVTDVGGWHLKGMQVGVRTTLSIPGALDPGDLDPISVHPLPIQEAVLAALGDLGFRFISADVEKGHVGGSNLPFYQEIELKASGEYASRINQLEVTYLVDDRGMDVVLEADRRGGLLHSGGDALSRFRVGFDDTDRGHLARLLHEQLQALGARRGWF